MWDVGSDDVETVERGTRIDLYLRSVMVAHDQSKHSLNSLPALAKPALGMQKPGGPMKGLRDREDGSDRIGWESGTRTLRMHFQHAPRIELG